MNVTSEIFCRSVGFSRKSSRLKSRERTSALAMAAATPNLMSCVRSTSRWSIAREILRALYGRLGREYRREQGRVPERYNQGMPVSFPIRQVANADFPTRWGHFRILAFEQVLGKDAAKSSAETGVALVMGDL